VNQKKAEADLAYDLPEVQDRPVVVKAEEVQVSIVKAETDRAAQQEIMRKQRELEGDGAKARGRRALPRGDRWRQREESSSWKPKRRCGVGRRRRRVLPSADVVEGGRVWRKRNCEPGAPAGRGGGDRGGKARPTAEAMRVKAESFKQYNEAAVIEMIVRILPEVAGKISEPLSKTEKMVIIQQRERPGRGASKLDRRRHHHHQPVAPVIESLTGIKFEKLLEQVPGLKKAMENG